VKGGADIAKAMRGRVSDRIRAYSNQSPNTTGRVSRNNDGVPSVVRDSVSHVQSSNVNREQSIGESIRDDMAKKGPLDKQENGIERGGGLPIISHESVNIQKANSPTSRRKLQYSQLKSSFPSDEFAVNEGTCILKDLKYYYRVTFKGVVSLLSHLDDCHDGDDLQQQMMMQSGDDDDDDDDPLNKKINNNNNNSSGTYYVGHGEIVATCSPEIILPLKVQDNDNSKKKQTFVRAIRVDSIVTGGYAADKVNDVSNDINHSIDKSMMEPSGNHHYGYLLLSSSNQQQQQHASQTHQATATHQATTIAEPIPTAMSQSLQSSCEHGSFLYRVSATSPVSVLSGPSTDAMSLGMGLLPGTIHEVSLRISIPNDSCVNNDGGHVNDDSIMLVDDADAGEIQFLRLGQRRGWIADRRIDVVEDDKLRVSYLVQDVTHEHNATHDAIVRRGGGFNLNHAALTGTGLMDASLSMSLDETSFSMNSSVLNSSTATANNSSFYSSVIASSVATPTTVRAQRKRRRHNRRRRADIDALGMMGRSMTHSTATLPLLVRDNNNTQRGMIGESFEEAGSSITGGAYSGAGGDGSMISGDHGDSSSFLSIQNQQPPPQPTKSYYLMRVIAPLGLKILDAPHFQVSNLIHSPSPHKMNNPRSSPTSPGISPFARTNAMIGGSSMSAENSPTMSMKGGGNGRKRTPRVRFLARGQIFEACQRMEITGDSSLYTNGQGLIKLADGSGWAIVPHQEDLMVQFKNYHHRGGGGDASTFSRNIHEIAAYEEIGNATIPIPVSVARTVNSRLTPPQQKSSERSLKDVVWLRITAPPNGIKVLLPPPQQQKHMNKKDSHTTPPPTHGRDEQQRDKMMNNPSTSHESEVASSVVSSFFFDSVWSRVSTPTKEKGSKDRHHSSAMNGATLSSLKQQQQQQPIIPVIPCGMVVPVERLDPSTSSKKKCFSRLFNGQGWIPRCLGEALYAYEVDTPDIRVGSFWFRVKSRSGLDVRHGPSSNAPTIKSDDDASFRFECGEFLRASEIMTVFNNKANSETGVGASAKTTECFAKLYRRRNHLGENDASQQTLLHRFSSLQSLISPGEWVQVHGHGELFLEECSAAPIIERNRDGWQYTVTTCGTGEGLHVRAGPSAEADIFSGELICEGEDFLVSEKVTADGDQAAWLRRKSGGWVHSIGNDGKAVVVETVASGVRRTYGDGQNNTEQSRRMVRQILEKGSRAAY